MAQKKRKARKKRQTMHVIFAQPRQQLPGPNGDVFFALDGTETKSRDHAAKCNTYESAQKLAKEKDIKLDGAMRYIGLMDFSEEELRNGVYFTA